MVSKSSSASSNLARREYEAQKRREQRESEEEFSCPECGSERYALREDRGEVICKECGLVLEDSVIDESHGPRAFSAEERAAKERTGSPITYTKHDKGISTSIGRGGELSQVAGSKRGQYYRLRKWHNRITKSKDRNLGFALSELQQLSSTLGLSRPIQEEVARLYEKAVDENLVKGRRIEHILAAIIYIVARNQGTPRTLEEIANKAGIEKRELGKAYRYVARELDLRVLPARPEDYLPKFAGELGVSGEVQAHARRILQQARDENLFSGKGPTGIAAAALYIASILEGEKRTQREVADAVGVTQVTLRNRYQEFVEQLGLTQEAE